MPDVPVPAPRPETPREERLRREAQALRDNLLRRKAQARVRTAPTGPASPPPARKE